MKRYAGIFIISIILVALGCGVASKEDEGFVLRSPAFVDGGDIPVKYACIYEPGGQNISPPLSWENPPSGTKSYVLFVHDPDHRAVITYTGLFTISLQVIKVWLKVYLVRTTI